ncbi:hypothetical protein JAG49_002518 [Morganella morganii]|nr:hypothetical protein [Morganella morganii]
MNLSFKENLILKMTALSVIFFMTLTACSSFSHSQNQHIKNSYSLGRYDNLSNIKMGMVFPQVIKEGFLNEGLMRCEPELKSFHKSLLLKNQNSLASHYQYQMSTTTQEIFNVVKIPESGPEWLSISISIIALLSSLGIPYIQHRKERKEAINEGYWIREVIMPKINTLAFNVTSEFKQAISSNQSVFLQTLRNTLLPKLGELRDSLYLFNSFKLLKDDIEALEEICDNLEERVSDNINEPQEKRISDISTFHSELINKLIGIHRKIG